MARPRVLAPSYGSAEHVKITRVVSTSPGRPEEDVTRVSAVDTLAGLDHPIMELTRDTPSIPTGPPLPITTSPTPPPPPRRFLPPPIMSDPALLSSTGQPQDVSFDDQVNQLQREVEKDKERRRMVSGLDTEDLNAMIRSFDKHVQHVRLCPPERQSRIPTGLDLHPDPEEEFTPNKVRSNLERLYASVGMGMFRVLKEIQRIGSWEDPTRSTVALTIYSYAWWCNAIIPTIIAFLSILVLIPSSRKFFFQTAAHRITSKRDGETVEGLVKERTESTWGPAATEQSATKWAESVQGVAQSMATAGTTSEEKDIKEGLEEQIEKGAKKDQEKMKSAGQEDPDDKDRSKKELVIRMYAQPGMRVLSGLADKWERFDHAVQPKGSIYWTDRRWAVFFQLLLPMFIMSILVTEKMISKAIGAAVGVGLFGNPLIKHIIHELDHTYPDWKSKLVLNLNLFDTVPTNAQLVLGLLRDAERRRDPLPPPPNTDAQPTDATSKDHGHDKALEQEDDSDEDQYEEGEATDKRKDVVSKLSHVTHLGKEGTRAKARNAWDKLGKAKEDSFAILAGHKKLDYHGRAERVLDKLNISTDHKVVAAALDRMPSRPNGMKKDSPSSFYVWHKKHGPGHVVIYPHDPVTATEARLEFTTIKRVKAEENAPIDPRRDSTSGHLVIPISDVVGLKKLGLGTVKHAALSWALDTDRAGGTGLEITVFREHVHDSDNAEGDVKGISGEEEKIVLASIVRRDELFNRLVALGEQRWELL